ncbi:MAG: Lar family restriction alleviation protein [Synergistaceae bacterium]|nr:Lar family restriction alleviation protein [Synergistaceae bacterium]
MCNNKDEIALKPCPFCGGEAEMKGTDTLCFVQCKNCYSCSMFSTPEEAAYAWDNRRELSLTNLANGIHANAKAHGWWDNPRSFGDIIALCHSELSEALEEYRNGKPAIYYGEDGKPEGTAVEMIDCIIRILDWCGHETIDVDEILKIKHEYNKSRPYRHGGKRV